MTTIAQKIREIRVDDRQRLLLEQDFRCLSDVTDNFFLQSLAEKILLCIHYYCLYYSFYHFV